MLPLNEMKFFKTFCTRYLTKLLIFCCAISPITLNAASEWRIYEVTDVSAGVDEISPDHHHLEVTVIHESVQLLLRLTRSMHNNRNVPVTIGYRGKNFAWKPKRAERFTVYQDIINKADIVVKVKKTTEGSYARVYQGSFWHKHKLYVIPPTVGTVGQRRSLKRRYVEQMYNTAKPKTAAFMDLIDATRYVVDVYMVIDYAIYSSWYDASAERTAANKRDDAINSIQYYYTQVANGMDLRYASIQAEFTINVRLSGLFIATTIADSLFTEGAGIKSVYNGVAYVEASRALTAIYNWSLSSTHTQPTGNQFILFTGNILKNKDDPDGKPIRISGLANIGAICLPTAVAVCQDWNYYATVGTATHELGHSLGALHDGQNNSCSSADQYIMSTAPTELNSSLLLNPFNFSSCSIAYFRQFFTDQSARLACLRNKTVKSSSDSAKPPVGQYVSIDKQCQLLYGVSSFYCGGADNDARMCQNLLCYSNVTGGGCVSRVEQRADDGTTCGDRKWCNKGQCVFDSAAPSATDYCLSGDYKLPLGDGQSCQQIIKANPGLCNRYNQTCCSSCKKFAEVGAPDCLYGDSDIAYCAKISNKDCYNDAIHKSCCETCKKFQSDVDDQDCAFGDKESWCSNIDSSSCYTDGSLKACCATCHYYSLFGFAGCQYGDKAAWCKNYTPQMCLETAGSNETCCRTCSSSAVVPIDPACTDSASYCLSVRASDCYALNKQCCRTCQSYYNNLTGCEYGDRYDWCSGQVEPDECLKSSVLDDCCSTCFKLKGVTRKPQSGGSGTRLKNKPAAYTILLILLFVFINQRYHSTNYQV